MADHDIVIRKYMEDKERFSDLMNGSLFDGKQVVKQENLEQIRKAHKRNGERLSDDEFLSGIKKEDAIYPVITVVIYYGEKEWDASLDLYGMMELGRKGMITEELKEVLPNYKINLIHAGNIESPEKYKSSLQLVFGMLKYKSDETGLKMYLEKHKKEL